MSEVAAGGYYYAENYAGNANTSHVATYGSFADPTLRYTYATPTAGGGLMSTYPVVIVRCPSRTRSCWLRWPGWACRATLGVAAEAELRLKSEPTKALPDAFRWGFFVETTLLAP